MSAFLGLIEVQNFSFGEHYYHVCVVAVSFLVDISGVLKSATLLPDVIMV